VFTSTAFRAKTDVAETHVWECTVGNYALSDGACATQGRPEGP
jgi:hypothetical protein